MKHFTLIIVGLLFSLNTFYCHANDKDSTKVVSFYNAKSYEKKYDIFKTIDNLAKFKNEKQWITFLDNEIASNKKDSIKVYYINLIKIDVYNNFGNIEQAYKITHNYYTKNKEKISKSLLCTMLNELNIYKEQQIASKEYSYLINEKIKVCPAERIPFYNFYSFLGLSQLAIKQYKKISNVDTKIISFKTGKDFNNIGVFHMRGQEYDSAVYYYNKSLKTFEKVKKNKLEKNTRLLNYWIGLAKGNIGQCYFHQEKYNKAIELFKEEKKEANIFFSGKNWTYLEAHYRDMGFSYLRLGNLQESKKYIDSLELKSFDYSIAKLKAEYFEVNKKYDSAVFYFRKSKNISDLLHAKLHKSVSGNFKSIIDLKEKTLKQESEIQKQKNRLTLYLLFSICFAIGFAFLLFFNSKLKDKNRIIENQKESIQKNLKEKSTLLKELHHRVKNNLQIISSIFNLQFQKIKEPETKKIFQYSINRISAISRINEKLFINNTLSQISLNNYINDIITELKNVYPSLNDVNFLITVDNKLNLNIDQTQAIGLIVNELLTNSYKYAFINKEKKKISLEISQKNDIVNFTYSDNGQGFDIDKININESIGLTLIDSLVKQLDSEAEFESNKGMITKFSFIKSSKL